MEEYHTAASAVRVMGVSSHLLVCFFHRAEAHQSPSQPADLLQALEVLRMGLCPSVLTPATNRAIGGDMANTPFLLSCAQRR